jgi:hypothetical protein
VQNSCPQIEFSLLHRFSLHAPENSLKTAVAVSIVTGIPSFYIAPVVGIRKVCFENATNPLKGHYLKAFKPSLSSKSWPMLTYLNTTL